MRRTLVHSLLSALVATAALLPSTTVAAGPTPSAARPAGAYSVLSDGARHAMVVIEWNQVAAVHARLTFKASGLTPGKRYRLVGSSASCGAPSPGPKRVFSAWFTVGARGAAWLPGASVDLLHGTWRDVRSTRLLEAEGIFWYCRSMAQFADTTFDDQADAAIAVLDAGTRHGIVIIDQVTETTVRIRHDIQIGSDDAPRLIGRSLGCSQPTTTQSILIGMLLPLRGHGQTFGNRTENVGKDESIIIGNFRSVWVRDGSAPPWACDAPSIIAVLIG